MPQIGILEQKLFYLGSWLVCPAKNQIQNNNTSKTIQPKLMEVLTYLCSKQNKIVSSDELIKQCWPHQYMSDNPIHKCIAQLRKALGDSSKNPKYIATIPKRGYSVIAKISILQGEAQSPDPFWLNESPFRGLKQYKEEHQDIFFGRSKAVSDILSLIDYKDAGSSSLIMLLGQSGCGKSSIVNAGLLPKLIHPYKPFKNQYLASYTFVSTTNEKQSADKLFLSFLYNHKILSHQVSLNDYYDYINQDDEKLKDYIEPNNIEAYQGSDTSQQIIIFIDQLENVFSHEVSKKSIGNFFNIIASLLASKKCLIISALRNEYYQELTETHCYIKIRADAYHYDIPPLSYDEICDIVRKPVQAAGLMYEVGPQNNVSLDTYLINKAQSTQVSLPILQYTLWELFKNKNNNTLTYSVYKNNGGMEGGLSTMAENTFLQLSPSSQVKFEELLHNLIQINPEAKDSARCNKAAIKSFTDSDIKKIIETFTDKRLFKTEWINNESYLSITHDILIKNWQRLQDWVKKNISLLNSQHEVKVATNRWLHHERSKDFLLNAEQPIRAANTISENSQINLSADEKAFIAASNIKFSFAKRLKMGMMSSLLISLLLSTLLAVSINSKNQQITITKNNAESLISFILYDLKDKLTPLGRVDLLDLVGSKTIGYFASIGTDNLSPTSLLHWIEALHIVGEVSFTKGDYDLAYNGFTKSEEIIASALNNDNDNIVLLEKYMLSNYWLGYINFIQNDFQLADIYMQKYLKLAQTLSLKQPEEHKWQLELSYALNNLGTLSVTTKQLKLANQYFTDSIAIKQKLLLKDPLDQLLIAEMADSVSWLGKIKQEEGDLRAKLKINQQSLSLSRKLILINPDSPQWSHRLSIALHRVALSFYDFADLTQAKKLIAESIALMESLVINDMDNFIYKKELINNYLLMAKINRHQNELDKGLFYIQKSQELVNLFKTKLKFSKKLAKYNIGLIIEQSIMMAKLNQKTIAIQSLDGAMNIWHDYFANKVGSTMDEDGKTSLALIQLTKAEILKTMPNSLEGRQQLLKSAHSSLSPFVNETSNNYQAIAMYLQIIKQLDNFGDDNELATKLRDAHYQNPDFTSAMHFNNIDNALSKERVEISLSNKNK